MISDNFKNMLNTVYEDIQSGNVTKEQFWQLTLYSLPMDREFLKHLIDQNFIKMRLFVDE